VRDYIVTIKDSLTGLHDYAVYAAPSKLSATRSAYHRHRVEASWEPRQEVGKLSTVRIIWWRG